MTESARLDLSDEVADLLEDAASVHDAEGRSELAQRHRRAAATLRRVDPAG